MDFECKLFLCLCAFAAYCFCGVAANTNAHANTNMRLFMFLCEYVLFLLPDWPAASHQNTTWMCSLLLMTICDLDVFCNIESWHMASFQTPSLNRVALFYDFTRELVFRNHLQNKDVKICCNLFA